MPSQRINEVEKIDVAYVANLARLHLSPEEIRTYQGQLNQIVGYVRKIGELDLKNIEPTSHARLLQNVFRSDTVKPSLDREIALKNAPKQANDQFMVPKIMEE
jgi:aspartyl-tRNA(Asn)/glutamyl-tRNA(Gln) amidotransferase subunit C